VEGGGRKGVDGVVGEESVGDGEGEEGVGGVVVVCC